MSKLKRFNVNKVEKVDSISPSSIPSIASELPATVVDIKEKEKEKNVDQVSVSYAPSISDSFDSIKGTAIYERESDKRVNRILKQLVYYDALGIRFSTAGLSDDPNKKKIPKSRLGTILGVYFPCIQNIFGVILFIRMVWVVGTAGWLEGFFIVFICCSCTMITSISMSAIATNGVVSKGGSYFMISRSLGPEFGGAVGFLFYLGTTVASSMYIVGAVEILLQYMAPGGSIFGPMNVPANAYNNYRVYGTALLLIMFFCVLIGVKFVSAFSPIALLCVFVSIICVYIGIFLANPSRGPQICFLGNRLLAYSKIKNNITGEMECNNEINNRIHTMYCIESERQEDCLYFNNNNATLKPGIPGLASGIFYENIWSNYSKENSRIKTNEEGNRNLGDILTDVSTSFVVLIGIFFPSVTGIMAGSNRSGDLKDAQKSIPVGTIGAVATTSFIYLSVILFFAGSINGALLMDKYGESLGGDLIVSRLAWPNHWVILIGSFLSTCGAGLQSLVGAPRLLQAIASDRIIPFLNPFADVTAKGEPIKGLLLTIVIAEIGVLIANVDSIAPIITMFFLMCYCFTNMACALQTLLKTPNWRPRFKFYHWSLSIIGMFLCLCIMFMSSWYYALAAIFLAAFIYKYIEYKGAEKEWGDGLTGLSISAARFALLRVENEPLHVKNWRPQLLVLVSLDKDLVPKFKKLLPFSGQLKAGKGFILAASVINPVLTEDLYLRKQRARKNLIKATKQAKLRAFTEVLIAKDTNLCLRYLVQGAGIGGLRHNTILMVWPSFWKTDTKKVSLFIETLHIMYQLHHAVLIVKGIDNFAIEKVTGTIDIWWIVHDGGLLILIPFLLLQHKVYKNCKLRIFTVAELKDNSIQMKKDIEMFLYNLRIQAEVCVVEMQTKDISAYTYERTLVMEQRHQMVMEIGAMAKTKDPQVVLENARKTDLKVNESKPADESAIVIEVITIQNNKDVSPNHEQHEDQDILSRLSYQPSRLKLEHPSEEDFNQFTFHSHDNLEARKKKLKVEHPSEEDFNQFTFHSHDNLEASKKKFNKNVRRMHSAVNLNEIIISKSSEANLVVVNLPAPPQKERAYQNYLEFVEVLTNDLSQLLLIRGGGREVITMYS